MANPVIESNSHEHDKLLQYLTLKSQQRSEHRNINLKPPPWSPVTYLPLPGLMLFRKSVTNQSAFDSCNAQKTIDLAHAENVKSLGFLGSDMTR